MLHPEYVLPKIESQIRPNSHKGWCQVAAESMPTSSLILGVDLSPIKPIPRVITFQSDITTDKCRAIIRGHLKTWKADTVLHDGAPNVGTAWVQDSFNQAELVLHSMKLATEFLREGGTFVTKVFRSKDYNSLLWVFNQLFTKVESTKPPSSRNVSAEIFVVCQGYKAPKRIDPRFLDPKSVFAELADPTPNNEAKVFNPEIKKRKRDGYEEGNYTQFKEVPASDFIQTTDPIAMLGSLNKFSFEQPPNGDVALAALDKLPDTTQEIRDCCADLRVLGRKEFRNLLRWRLKVREQFGLSTKKNAQDAVGEEVAEVEPMDEELKIQEELQNLNDKESSKRKRERRRENEKKQKEIIRMQLHMTAPMDIGLDNAGPHGDGSMFGLKTVDKTGAAAQIARGKMAILVDNHRKDHDSGLGSEETDDESDEEQDRLDRDLDAMYEQYQERKSDLDAKYRAKKARKEHDDGEWEGCASDQSGSDEELEEDSDDDASDSGVTEKTSLITDLSNAQPDANGLSRKAAQFFAQDIFKDIVGVDDLPDTDDDIDGMDDEAGSELKELDQMLATRTMEKVKTIPIEADQSDSSDGEDTFEVVKRNKSENDQWADEPTRNERPDIDIITAEAMTLAQQLASGAVTRSSLIDANFTKHNLKDRDGLPEWFLDDEKRHDKPHRPITAAAAAAIKEKMRALNARPIKKVREAKDRKKLRTARRLEKLKKKSALLLDEEGMTEREKAQGVEKLMAKAKKGGKPKRSVRVVVAMGNNKGIAGRPRGVKGKYKLVDARLKKDVRAEKRTAAKKKR